LIQRVLSIPNKRYDRAEIEFLDSHEIEALLAALTDVSTRLGRRDRTLLLVAVQTGLRVSELIALRCEDVMLGNGAHVRCMGKGRKERCTPLRKDAEHYAPGFVSVTVARLIPCFPVLGAARSGWTELRICFQSIWLLPASGVHH
jgi:integrase/recombinase XerD